MYDERGLVLVVLAPCIAGILKLKVVCAIKWSHIGSFTFLALEPIYAACVVSSYESLSVYQSLLTGLISRHLESGFIYMVLKF